MEKNKVSDNLISDRVEDVVSRRKLERIVEDEDLEGEEVPACVTSDVGESDVGGSVGSMEKQLTFGNADSAPKGGDDKEGERCVVLFEVLCRYLKNYCTCARLLCVSVRILEWGDSEVGG
ncbi:hypothetical protein NDU88_000940 [Pleurodeles waltl]|uniref:Uncharacterized protein n=1 Tax=Pleurodeles waltl TaxID=8319 RepID=A0AAV7Q2L3_PLEWA|nr:hypothetical protein NDU88_000940 [Pleurodeles waltl]